MHLTNLCTRKPTLINTSTFLRSFFSSHYHNFLLPLRSLKCFALLFLNDFDLDELPLTEYVKEMKGVRLSVMFGNCPLGSILGGLNLVTSNSVDSDVRDSDPPDNEIDKGDDAKEDRDPD